uniref:Uncharacterized protein n=1 Tax=Lotus japonicus TaxID=34305 RepID=I3S8T2_LOTJA|nr:unknown [Lotus japonicus]
MESLHYIQKHQRRKRRMSCLMLIIMHLQTLTCLQWFQLLLKSWELPIRTNTWYNQPPFLSQPWSMKNLSPNLF